ncbi:LysM peptidoglycan-binding domain-containing protein [Streptomyces sp. HB2AG]|uniref:LysM peptidoglycan-binding domain-containing protein n=1 Tax=Streptomyces sp. HB2AG TaxID=2983400 RepID=UPI0022AA9ED5|nr:hypothetical protein [Streptomyces sp. HB2AG]MCZ2523694.1 hypothetical protein [Streptomyces sp. HB2AG]
MTMDRAAAAGPADALPAASPYPPSSRYHDCPIAVHVGPDGGATPYVRHRLLPRTEEAAPAGAAVEHVVEAGDRLDVLAHRYLGDAGQWWRIADANDALDPRELTAEPGRRILVPLPGGTVSGVARG